MATARNTVGSLLDTVSTAANVVTGGLGSISVGVSMANAYMRQAEKRQVKQYLIDDETLDERLLEESAYEQAEADLKIAAYRNKSEQHKLGYDQAYARLSAILRKPAEPTVVGFRTAAE